MVPTFVSVKLATSVPVPGALRSSDLAPYDVQKMFPRRGREAGGLELGCDEELEDCQLHRLVVQPWPEALFFGAEGQRESVLGLTNNQATLLTWRVDGDGPTDDNSTYQW